MMLRQLHFSELDLVLHSRYVPQEGSTVFDSEVVKQVDERTTVLKPLPGDRSVCGLDGKALNLQSLFPFQFHFFVSGGNNDSCRKLNSHRYTAK